MEELYQKYINQGFTHQEARQMAKEEKRLKDLSLEKEYNLLTK